MSSVVPALLVLLGSVITLAATTGWLPPTALTGGAGITLAAGLWLVVTSLRNRRLALQRAQENERAADEANTWRIEAAKLRQDLERLKAQSEAERREAKAQIVRAGREEAVGLLGLLQQRGRLLDFLMDDVAPYQDAQIGAAARVVHQGCAGVVREFFDIKPVHDGSEGAPLTLAKDYDAHRYRVVGRVIGEPPFRGTVLHRGWRTTAVKLPERVETVAPMVDTGIIAPAEIELS